MATTITRQPIKFGINEISIEVTHDGKVYRGCLTQIKVE